LLAEVGMSRLTAHISQLTADFLDDLRDLRHGNGTPLVCVYGPRDMTARGGAVAFNVCDRNGMVIPYSIVESEARRANVSLRGGCFCNPGASEAAFSLDAARVAGCFETLGAGFTPERFAECSGAAVGAVRASIGLSNNADDIRRAIDVVASFRE
jgi:selenocysteine lyase/cysteine desulfurase